MFRAYDAERERPVAVKLFKLDLPPERVHQLVAALDEVIVAELAHPSIVAPLAAGIIDVSAYLAQQYVAAQSLDLALREYGPAPPADAIRVAAQLAGALDFAAVVGIVHGTLHPRDVLISADETRVTGIGIAHALEQAGIAAPVRRPYSAPERVAGRPWDRRADVFGLAALVHELLWGRRVAGTGTHAADALAEIEGGDLLRLRDVFARALADDPADRFGTALEFADALKHAFSDVTVVPTAAPPSTGESPRNGARTEKAVPRLPLEEPALPVPITAAPVAAAAAPSDVARRDVATHDVATREIAIREVATSDVATRDVLADSASADSLPLRSASGRYQDVEAEPEIPLADMHPRAEMHARADLPVAEAPIAELPIAGVRAHDAPPLAEAPVTLTEPPPISMLERSRSAVWPLVAALAIGLALGYAGGYGIGSQDRGTAPTGTPAVTASQSTAVTTPTGRDTQAGREATEVAIAQPSTPDTVAPNASPTATLPKPNTLPASGQTASPETRIPPERHAASSRTPERTAARRVPQRPVRPVERTSTAAAVASGTAGRFIGSLDVDSRPTGASVFLDGKLIGTTPLRMPTIPAGEHAIRLEREGYRRWSSSIRVVASERNRVTASLER